MRCLKHGECYLLLLNSLFCECYNNRFFVLCRHATLSWRYRALIIVATIKYVFCAHLKYTAFKYSESCVKSLFQIFKCFKWLPCEWTWHGKQCKETRFYIFNKRLMLLVMIFVTQQTNSIQLVFMFAFYFHFLYFLFSFVIEQSLQFFCEQKFIPVKYRYFFVIVFVFWFLLTFISKLYLQL